MSYVHLRYAQETDSRTEAEASRVLLNAMMECLAKEFPVYLRIVPEIVSVNAFESSSATWLIRARFSVGQPNAGVDAGLIRPAVYDAANMLGGFGLEQHK
jgi:hypothetical protein